MEITKEFKEKKYLQICGILDDINKSANFCNIRTVDGKFTCNGIFKNREELCCKDCKHISEKGCTVKSIMCKISFCYMNEGPTSCGLTKTRKQRLIVLRRNKIINIIYSVIYKYDIPCYSLRASMEEQFKIQKDYQF